MTDFKRQPDISLKPAVRVNLMTMPVFVIVIVGGVWFASVMSAWLG